MTATHHPIALEPPFVWSAAEPDTGPYFLGIADRPFVHTFADTFLEGLPYDAPDASFLTSKAAFEACRFYALELEDGLPIHPDLAVRAVRLAALAAEWQWLRSVPPPRATGAFQRFRWAVLDRFEAAIRRP